MLSHAGSAPSVEEFAYNLKYTGLADHDLTWTENNICLVGALQVHHDMTYVDSCKNKKTNTKKFATTNHAPPSTCLYKGFAESLQGNSGCLRRELPVSLLGLTINLSLLQTSIVLASLWVRHRDLSLVTLLFITSPFGLTLELMLMSWLLESS